MKIAFLNIHQGKVFRGSETFVYELSRRLSKNHQVDVISNINYYKLFKEKYDVIVPTNGRFQAVLTRFISWLSGAKMIVSGQSGIGWDDKVNLLVLPDAFVALTSKAQKWAKLFNPFVRVEKIPNGVDLARFKITDPRSKSNNKTVLSVGAFTKQKRLDLVIRAVSKLQEVNLVIAGANGELEQELTNLGTKTLGERFKIMTVPFEKMPEIYRSASVFTLPSASSESFGNVLVEAMACGLPVVAVNDDQRKEIVGDAGIFIDPTNIDEYSAAIKKALQTDWGNRPRIQAEKFSWDKISNEYEKLFNSL